jgi:hypothetical protein
MLPVFDFCNRRHQKIIKKAEGKRTDVLRPGAWLYGHLLLAGDKESTKKSKPHHGLFDRV